MSTPLYQSSAQGSSVSDPSPAPCPTVACFHMRTEADPAALSRVIEHFALLNVVPDMVKARRFADNSMIVDIKVHGLTDERVEVIGHKLRAVVVVHSVTVDVFAVGCDLEDYRVAHGTNRMAKSA